jgi:hypothetical protein
MPSLTGLKISSYGEFITRFTKPTIFVKMHNHYQRMELGVHQNNLFCGGLHFTILNHAPYFDDKKIALIELYPNATFVFDTSFFAELCINDYITDKYIVRKTYDDHKKFIKDSSLDMLKSALSQNGRLLKYVEKQKQTEELCKIAIQENPYAIKFVNEQTEELCKIAIQKKSIRN